MADRGMCPGGCGKKRGLDAAVKMCLSCRTRRKEYLDRIECDSRKGARCG